VEGEETFLGPTVSYQNMVDFKGERSLSGEDVTHRIVIGHVYQLPFGRGKRFGSSWPSVLDKTLGGWQFSGMTTFQSGFPLPITETGHTTGAFGGTDRPNLVGNPCLSTGRSRGARISNYFNVGAFQTPPNFTFGDAPRVMNCRQDGMKNFDLSAVKFIPIKEQFQLEIRSEFLNAFNRPMLAAPSTVFNSGAFGHITSQYNVPRIIQFALKVHF
jgi:hypothetical protein